MMYLQLFLSFIQVGIFSFGGGYAAMPLIQSQVVTNHRWLTMSEFTDLITISQMTPGPIAVNSATFVGLKIAGVLGAVVATFGCILPSCIIVTVLAKLYLKYRSVDMMQEVLYSLRPAVVAMIASAGILILMTAFWGNGTVTFVKTKWGLAFGISSRPLMPTAGKVLLSKVRIPKTKEFAKSLILTKEDYRLMKLYNYMVVV